MNPVRGSRNTGFNESADFSPSITQMKLTPLYDRDPKWQLKDMLQKHRP